MWSDVEVSEEIIGGYGISVVVSSFLSFHSGHESSEIGTGIHTIRIVPIGSTSFIVFLSEGRDGKLIDV